MSDVGYLANLRGGPFNVAVSGIPKPVPAVVNVTTNSTHTDRQISLMAAVQYHQDLTNTDEEMIVNTAMVFAYYLEHGEYPPG